MKRYWNNEERSFHSSKLLTLSSKLSANRSKFLTPCSMILALCLILCWVLYPDSANSGHYLNSAHGNTNYGVKRSATGFPTDYTRGLCAHCHEQHSSIDGTEPEPNTGGAAGPDKYLLFSRLFVDQNTLFCFRCHRTTNSLQLSMPLQYNYSNIAGGDSGIIDPNSIRDMFNTPLGGSGHYLDGIRTFLSDRNWEFGSITNNIDPCSGCHNPHRAKRDHHGTDITPTRTVGGYLLVSAVSRPSQHTDLTTWQLWGDENGERMVDYSPSYQAPCQYPYPLSPPYTCTKYEPDGSNITNGSNLFDTVTFCLDCHGVTDPNIPFIDWGPAGDQHGAASQICCDWGDVKEPYSQSGSKEDFNYVLSCLDCHEPHGSPNEYLLRSEVNGVHTGSSNGLTFDTHQYWYFCSACHTNLSTKHTGASINPTSDCWGCHRHGVSLPFCGCTAAKTF